jgi:hypothetical protein
MRGHIYSTLISYLLLIAASVGLYQLRPGLLMCWRGTWIMTSWDQSCKATPRHMLTKNFGSMAAAFFFRWQQQGTCFFCVAATWESALRLAQRQPGGVAILLSPLVRRLGGGPSLECICAAVYIVWGSGRSPSRSRRRAVDMSRENPAKAVACPCKSGHDVASLVRAGYSCMHLPQPCMCLSISNNSWFVCIWSERPDMTVWLLRYEKLERALQRAAEYFYGCTWPYICTCMFSFWASFQAHNAGVYECLPGGSHPNISVC